MKLYNYPKTDELGFLDMFLGHLEELLTYRPELIEILREQIEKLYMEFGFLRSFLRKMKAQLNEHEELEDLWTRIIRLAYQAEHVIDFYVVKYASDSRIMLSLSGIIEQTMLTKSEVAIIYDEKKYHTQAHKVSKTFIHVSPKATDTTTAEMVGFKEEADMIKKYLVGSKKELNVACLVGFPGTGKTTLSKKIYEDHSIINYFDVRAWCSTSQTFRRRELLLTILGEVISVTKAINKLNDEKLAKKLYESLKGCRYLIVIDDLWDFRAWDDLKESLPDDNIGSRILITSRFQDLASKTKAVSFVHVVRPLTNDESWELFQKGNFFKEFWEVGKRILEKCMGLPLAVVLVVGLLKMVEERLHEWNKIAESLSSQVLSDSKNPIEVILELSYNYLPDYLKSCFLYFGAFVEEDKEISVWKLKQLLDLSCINIGKSINRIGLLIHLRYLALQSDTRSIPLSIANLWNLQSFLFYANNGKVLVPDSLWDMVNLRHVYIHPGAYFDVDPDRLEKSSLLDKLETLSTPHFYYKAHAEKLLKRLPKLRKLSYVLKGIIGDQLVVLDLLYQLRSLKVTFEGPLHQAGVRFEFRLPVNLQKLTLINLKQLPDEISKFGMKLPNLKVLKLIGADFNREPWTVYGGNFPKLKYLKLSDLRYMSEWIVVSEYSFPVIEQLVLDNCRSPDEIPSLFGGIPTMRTIIVKNCQPSLEDSAREIQRNQQEEMGNTELKVYIYPKLRESSS